MIEDTFDDHEVTSLRSEAFSTRDFLVEQVEPFFKYLESKPAGDVPLSFIREMRREINSHKESSKKAAYTHLQRSEKGLAQMHGNYHIYTNHIPRYAFACTMEILLRAYQTLLSQFDPEDPLTESYWSNLHEVAVQKCQRIYELYEEYLKKRVGLVTYRFE